MMATYEEILAKSKELAAAGDMDGARRLAQIAIKRRPKPEGKGAWQAIKENIVGDNDPTTQNFGEKVGTLLNMGGEAMTLGLVGDEAAAMADSAIGRGTYDDRLSHYRGQQALTQDENPYLSFAAQVAPAFLPGAGAAGVIGKLPNLAAKIGASGILGGLTGATYGFMEGEGGVDSRAAEAAQTGLLSAGLGAAVPAIGAGVRSVLNSNAAGRAIAKAAKGAPTAAELREIGNALYKQVDEAGVQVRPEAFDRARATILDRLRTTTGFDELPGPGSLTPNSARVNQIMDEASARMAAEPTAALPIRSLDQMRQQAGAAAGNVANKSDQKAGMTIIEGLDDLIGGLTDADVVAGDVEALQTALPKARDVWSRMSKTQVIEDAIAAGEDYLSGASSGIRNQFKNILRNKKMAARFTEAEKTAMRRVINGSIPERLLNLAGGGLGQLMQVGGGFATGPVGGLIGTAGAVLSRKAAEAVTKSKAEAVRGLIANGGLTALPSSGQLPAGLLEAALLGALPSQSLNHMQSGQR